MDIAKKPSLEEAIRLWVKIGFLSFGGPAAQIALMHRELVEIRGWMSEQQYLRALSFCMLLPGPEAMQLATYSGWLLHGWRGGLIAGLAFVLPGAALLVLLSLTYFLFGETSLLQAVFFGVKAAVLAIVLEALLRLGRRALKRQSDWMLAGAAFLALFAFAVPFPLVIAAAALFGALRDWSVLAPERESRPAAKTSIFRTISVALLWAAIWFTPVAIAAALLGRDHVLVEIGLFFSLLAVVTFGGAYAVLAYMAQAAVATYGWLTTAQMIDGLGLAETTPGPLILVTSFVGFLGAAQSGEGPAIAIGLAGAAMTLWVTFAPCFLWIFAGAPYVEGLADRPRLAGALAGITAAVVGVIFNLSLWFAFHVLFKSVGKISSGPFSLQVPDVTSFEPRSAAIALLAAILILRFHRGIAETLIFAALLGGLFLLGPEWLAK